MTYSLILYIVRISFIGYMNNVRVKEEIYYAEKKFC